MLIDENENLLACSFQKWHKDFEKLSIKSICIEIPKKVVQYLLDEIIILPKECYVDELDSIEHPGYENDDTEESGQPEFPEFSKLIQQKIDELGGSVYIKTNWHSPKDAFWITAGQTMRCKDITDVYQLLKASSICKTDLANFNSHQQSENENDDELGATSSQRSSNDVAGGGNDDDDDDDDDFTSEENKRYLILKKWTEIHPGSEFRCYVRNDHLIAISPRDWPQFHEHIVTQKTDIINDIRSIFREKIKWKFLLNDYVFDVVRDEKDKVFLIDISPFGSKYSEPLAFEWEELMNDFDIENINDDPEFRYLTTDCGIQPSKRNNYGIPKDVIDVYKASATDQGSNSLDEFLFSRLRNISDEQQRNQNDE